MRIEPYELKPEISRATLDAHFELNANKESKISRCGSAHTHSEASDLWRTSTPALADAEGVTKAEPSFT